MMIVSVDQKQTKTANIELVCDVKEENQFSTYDDIQAETSLCHGTINHIIHDCLKMRKITSRWVPYALSEKNKADRVQICIENLNKFKNKTWRLGYVVTGEESWFIGDKSAANSQTKVGSEKENPQEPY